MNYAKAIMGSAIRARVTYFTTGSFAIMIPKSYMDFKIAAVML